MKKTPQLALWKGAESREMEMRRPCSCGCDDRGEEPEHPLIGYLTGSNDEGYGFTISIYDEADYQQLRRIFGGDS